MELSLSQNMWQPGWDGSLGEEWIHVYGGLSPFSLFT